MNLETGEDYPDWHLLGFQDKSAVLQSPLGVIQVQYESKTNFVHFTRSLNNNCNTTAMDVIPKGASDKSISQRCTGKHVLLKKFAPNGKLVTINVKSLGSISVKNSQQLTVQKIEPQTNNNFYKIKLPDVSKNSSLNKLNYSNYREETTTKSDQLHRESSKDVCQSLSTDNRYRVRTNTLSLALEHDNGSYTTEPVREKPQFDKGVCSSDVQFVKNEPCDENAGNLILLGNVVLPKLNGVDTTKDIKLTEVNKLVPPLREESYRGVNIKCNQEVISCLTKVPKFLEVSTYSSANSKFPPKGTEVDDHKNTNFRNSLNQTSEMGKIKHFKEKNILQENDKNINSIHEKQIDAHVNDKYSTNTKDIRNCNSDTEYCGTIKSRRVRRKRVNHSQYIQQQIEKYMRRVISGNSKRYRKSSSGKQNCGSRNRSQDFSCQVSICCKSLDKSRAIGIESHSSPASHSIQTVEDFDIDLDISGDLDISEVINDVDMGYGPPVPNKVMYNQSSEVNGINRYDIPGNVLFHNSSRNSQMYHFNDNLSMQDNSDRLELFKKLTSCTVPDLMGNLPIHWAVQESNLTEVKTQCWLLHLRGVTIDITNNNNLTPLQLGIINCCSLDIVQLLIANGASINAMDSDGNTIIHLAIMYSQEIILAHLLMNSAPINVNVFNYEGLTPLMYCVLENRSEMAERLLECKADPDTKDQKSGRTALFYAVENNNLEMVKLLLRYKANTKIRNFFGTSTHDAIFELDHINPEIKSLIVGRELQVKVKRPKERKIRTSRYEKGMKLDTTKTFRKMF